MLAALMLYTDIVPAEHKNFPFTLEQSSGSLCSSEGLSGLCNI